ncbi:MAG: hypothetical protein JOZ53_09155 [Planctomycetaceae bacterium]|nr:hypothetical protein [Planctomycetaceae bacterium]
MPSVKTRLERLERARTADVRCVWLYAGWGCREGTTDVSDGVYCVFVPEVPPALPPGLMVVLRHPDRDGAEVSAATAAWALEQLALGPRPRALVAAAKVLVLVTAGGPAPPPEAEAEAAGAAPPGAAAGPPPVAEEPPPPVVEEPPPPAASSPPPAPPPWPEWLPR